MSHEAIADKFDDWARQGRGKGMEHGHGDVVRQVVESLDVRPGHQILDLGCGTGWATRILAQRGTGATGIDVSPEMIAQAKELTSFTIRARFEVCPFETLDFPDAKFDLVFSMEALYYAVDLDKALSEILRVLKPGGTVEIVIDCYAERPMTAEWSEEMGLELHHLAEAEWRGRFEAAGFSDVTTARVLDSRGAGEAADFQVSACFKDRESYVAFHEAGSLHIRAAKRA